MTNKLCMIYYRIFAPVRSFIPLTSLLQNTFIISPSFIFFSISLFFWWNFEYILIITWGGNSFVFDIDKSSSGEIIIWEYVMCLLDVCYIAKTYFLCKIRVRYTHNTREHVQKRAVSARWHRTRLIDLGNEKAIIIFLKQKE